MKKSILLKTFNEFSWPPISVLAVTLLLSLGQLQRWQITPGLAIYAHELVVAATVLVSSFHALKSFTPLSIRKVFQLHRWLIMFLAWTVLGLGIASMSGQPILTAVMRLMRLGSYFLFGKQLLEWLKHKQLTPQYLQVVLIFSLGLIALWGVIQYLLLPDTRFLSILGWDDHYYRLVSTWLDPAFTGLALALGWWWVFEWKVLKRLKPHTQYSLALLFLISLLLTYSRSSYLAFAVLLSAALVNSLKKTRQLAWLTVVTIIFTSSWWWLPRPASEGTRLERTASVNARVEVTKSVVEKTQNYQWLVGRGLFVPISDASANHSNLTTPNHAVLPDNIFLTLVSGLGLIGIGILAKVIWQYRQLAVPTAKWWPVWIAVTLHSMFNNSLLQPFVTMIIIIAIVSDLPLAERRLRSESNR